MEEEEGTSEESRKKNRRKRKTPLKVETTPSTSSSWKRGNGGGCLCGDETQQFPPSQSLPRLWRSSQWTSLRNLHLRRVQEFLQALHCGHPGEALLFANSVMIVTSASSIPMASNAIGYDAKPVGIRHAWMQLSLNTYWRTMKTLLPLLWTRLNLNAEIFNMRWTCFEVKTESVTQSLKEKETQLSISEKQISNLKTQIQRLNDKRLNDNVAPSSSSPPTSNGRSGSLFKDDIKEEVEEEDMATIEAVSNNLEAQPATTIKKWKINSYNILDNN
ncbi:unnamed protein product [Lepeophtheirus salmonis]|uniref:(salmon louse) hypothetical protein n=1 Tax=Lepeophtheirus salmonis TaxID=72036 RepID=A0A7R8HCR2_LEPSM|nr:unnamed protein product [Lepeophtheirus salmonis]CAF3015449.1 unnamed protein product [Lepeophtheirus salmonis]